MSKTRAAYRITQRLKVENTEPEQRVREILTNLGYEWQRGRELSLESDEGPVILRPDIVIPHNPLIICEVDGPYHRTDIQRRKTHWRDGLLKESGIRIIHVDTELTENEKLRAYLSRMLDTTIKGDSWNEHLYA